MRLSRGCRCWSIPCSARTRCSTASGSTSPAFGSMLASSRPETRGFHRATRSSLTQVYFRVLVVGGGAHDGAGALSASTGSANSVDSS